ncbi:hypothetical protein Dimus_013222, partial [Dionaea muscipula]
LRDEMVVHSSKRLFGKVEESRNRKAASPPLKGKKEKKVKRKLILDSETVASNTIPSKGSSQKEEVEQRRSKGEAHEGDQASRMAQEPPHEGQDPIRDDAATTDAAVDSSRDVMKEVVKVAQAAATEIEKEVGATYEVPIIIEDPINIEEMQRFNAWLSWKLSRSRAQAEDIERMHLEEDWVMSMVDCYEIFELVDAGKLIDFFKVSVAAHKRHNIKQGKRPVGEDSHQSDHDDDNNDDGGDDPATHESVPNPTPSTEPQPQAQQTLVEEEEVEEDAEKEEEKEIEKEAQTDEHEEQEIEKEDVDIEKDAAEHEEEKDDQMEEDAYIPKNDVPGEPSRGVDEDEDERISDPIWYDSPIDSIEILTSDEHGEEVA